MKHIKLNTLATVVRKISAIILLLVLLFNTGGYRLLLSYFQHQSDKALESYFDSNAYDEKDLITIKVPLHMPYQTNGSDFERVDGKVELDGKIYKYVKRKIYDGELILLCLPDKQSEKLETAKNEFFKIATDVSNTLTSKHHGNNSMAGKLLFSLYCKQAEPWSLRLFINNLSYHQPQNIIAHSSCAVNAPGKPPQYFM